jgi:hypothetical protein
MILPIEESGGRGNRPKSQYTQGGKPFYFPQQKKDKIQQNEGYLSILKAFPKPEKLRLIMHLPPTVQSRVTHLFTVYTSCA